MDRRYTVGVIALSSAAWTLAITAAMFNARHPIVNVALSVAVTSSFWVMCRYTADRLKREILSELTDGVRQIPKNGGRR